VRSIAFEGEIDATNFQLLLSFPDFWGKIAKLIEPLKKVLFTLGRDERLLAGRKPPFAGVAAFW